MVKRCKGVKVKRGKVWTWQIVFVLNVSVSVSEFKSLNKKRAAQFRAAPIVNIFRRSSVRLYGVCNNLS